MNKEINIKLIQQCASKDRLAQKQLYDVLLPYLNAIAKRYLNEKNNIEDVLQEVFVRIFKNIKNYDANKSSFKTWVTKITINCCWTDNKKNEDKYTQTYQETTHDIVTNPDVLEKLSTDDVRLWLKQLPENYYAVFNLYVIEGFSHEEIAEMLDIKISLSRKRLSRAKQWLQKNTIDKQITS